MATMAIAGQGMEQMQARRTHTRTVSIAERNRALVEAQRARRRGPTPEMFFTKHIDNTRLVKADDPDRHREMRLFTMVMTLRIRAHNDLRLAALLGDRGRIQG